MGLLVELGSSIRNCVPEVVGGAIGLTGERDSNISHHH
jgi:hypothetical protein